MPTRPVRLRREINLKDDEIIFFGFGKCINHAIPQGSQLHVSWCNLNWCNLSWCNLNWCNYRVNWCNFRDFDISVKCENYCTQLFLQCLAECDDDECYGECHRDDYVCVDSKNLPKKAHKKLNFKAVHVTPIASLVVRVAKTQYAIAR